MQRHRFTLRLRPLISGYQRHLHYSGIHPTPCPIAKDSEPNELSCRSLCLLRRAMFSRSRTRVSDAANNGLHQTVDAFFFVTIHHAEAKLGFALGPLANTNG